jgi:hypothetical protein
MEISEESKQSSRKNETPTLNKDRKEKSSHRFPYMQCNDKIIENLCQDALLQEMADLQSVSSFKSSMDPSSRNLNQKRIN